MSRTGFSAGTAGGTTQNVAISQDGDDANVKVVQSALPLGAATEKTLAALVTAVGGSSTSGLATESTLAALSAKFTPGTAGTPSPSVTSVQGVPSGIPVPVICTSGCSSSSSGAGPAPTGSQNLLYALDDYTANLVPNGASVFAIADKTGRQINITGCNADSRGSGNVMLTTTTVTPMPGFPATPGYRWEVYDVVAANTSATPVILVISYNSVIMAVLPVPSNFAGVVHSFNVPLTAGAGGAVSVQIGAAATAVYVTLTGCKAR